MGWQDRSYYRDSSASSGNPFLWLLSGSMPLFTVFGIRVRMHASLVTLIVLELLLSETRIGMGITNAMTFTTLLFGIVLLHEFGHCFAARKVGGEANEILLWPLGGLAYCDAPNRPWPQLVTAVGGPLVNVAICLVAGPAVWAIGAAMHGSHSALVPLAGMAYYLLAWAFGISLALLIFNLLPIFPMDGGRILQCLLWFKLRYYRATLITCMVGMIGAVLMGMYGLAFLRSIFGLFLVMLAVSCFMTCFQLRAQLKAEGPWAFEEDGIDYSASIWHPDDQPRKHKKLSRRAKRRLRKQADAEENEQARIDAILAKVSAQGMHSLTWMERRALRKATARQRRREIEVSQD